jgi:flagellar motor component MotA
MRTVVLITVFAVLAGVFCGGGKPVAQTNPSAAAAKWPAEATGTLTENELAQFVKVLPAFSAALKAANWTPVLPQDSDGPVATLTSYVEQMNVPGLEEALKPAGSSWGAVRPTLYKVFAASAALSIDATPPEMVAQMRADTSAGAKKSLKDYEAFKAACSQIPEANKQMVASHQQELQALQTLGR